MIDEDNADDPPVSTSQSLYQNSVLSIKKGILLKKGMGNIFRPWSLRTISVDTENRLSYFDRDILKGSFYLDGTIINKIDSELADGKFHAFEVSNIPQKKQTLLLAASCETEADEWISCLRAASALQSSKTPGGGSYVSLTALAFSGSVPLDLQRIKEIRKSKKQSKERLAWEVDDESAEEDNFL